MPAPKLPKPGVTPPGIFRGEAYSSAALTQIPRALTLLDRNPASPTYGCFDRSWWLDRSTDFPNALAQYAVHGLALVWAYPLKDNPYYRKPVVREWALAGLDFLTRQAHSDGSFDEFYPNERGWSGPSGFLLYALLSTYEILQVPPESELGLRVRSTALKCARMHLERTEKGTLANHYAMAFMPIAKACRVLGEESLREPLSRRFEDLLALQDPEGWFREYDGPDPGYLLATVSFLAKMEREGFQHPGLRPAVKKALHFASYFLWPDGTFSGALGSRQTVHLYPHGLEYFATVFPEAAALAKAARRGFAAGGFVPPAIQSDHYYHYRVNELLEAALEASSLPARVPPLPFERKPFTEFFKNSGILAVKTPKFYTGVNLRKGGAFRAYAMPSGKVAAMDSGLEVRTRDGQAAAANWVNPRYEIKWDGKEAAVQGRLCRIPFKSFNVPKFMLFRLVVSTLGAFPALSESMKGFFRRLLTLGIRETDMGFKRQIRFHNDRIQWEDWLSFGTQKMKNAWVGAELPLRYVPQSRHFQESELNFATVSPSEDVLKDAHRQGGLHVQQSVRFPSLERKFQFRPATPEKGRPPASGAH